MANDYEGAYYFEVKDVDWARQFLADRQTGGEASDPDAAKGYVSEITVEDAKKLAE